MTDLNLHSKFQLLITYAHTEPCQTSKMEDFD